MHTAFEVEATQLDTILVQDREDTENYNNAAGSSHKIEQGSMEILQDDTYKEIHQPKRAGLKDGAIKAFVYSCAFLACACALFVPIWKIVDTSYLFRERDDPSLFDNVTAYFSSDSRWPFAKNIDNGKDTYRVYFFVMPFALSFFFVSIKALVATKRKITLKKPQLPNFFRYRVIFGLSGLDLALITATLAYSALLLWMRMKRSQVRGARKLTFLYQDSKEELDPISWEGCEIMAKTFGVLTIVMLGWFVLMPVGRHSVLLEVFGIQWEVAIKYHRWLGWYTLAILLAHTFTYIAVWAHANGDSLYDPEGDLLRHMMVPGSCNDGSCDEDENMLHVEMMWGFASLLIMIIMSAFAINYVRRRYFEVFYYTHQLFRLLVLFLCFHYAKTMLYLIPGVVMIVIDKSIGYLSLFGSVKATSHPLAKDLFELKVKKDPRTRCEAGQYVFINVPSVSVLEWHPITVTWTTETELAVHIKTRGPGSWTHSVFEEICSSNVESIDIRLDGFYGANQIEEYGLLKKKAVLLFCGGCGLTFPFSIITELCRANSPVPVYLHWVTRTKEEYAAFEGLLLDIKNGFDNLSVFVWVTLHGQKSDTDDGPSPQTNYFPASTPSTTKDQIIIGTNKKAQSAYWRPFLSSWLRVSYIHAGMTSLAIVMGTLGYSLSRKNELEDEVTARALLVNRFLNLFLVIILSSVVLYIMILLRIAWNAWGPKVTVFPQKLFTQSRSTEEGSKEEASSREVSTHQEDTRQEVTSLEALSNLDTSSWHTSGSMDRDWTSVEIGESPIVAGFGERPDIEDIFNTFEQDHPTNVAVLACGPRCMVKTVKDECQKRVWESWFVSAEEWEW